MVVTAETQRINFLVERDGLEAAKKALVGHAITYMDIIMEGKKMTTRYDSMRQSVDEILEFLGDC